MPAQKQPASDPVPHAPTPSRRGWRGGTSPVASTQVGYGRGENGLRSCREREVGERIARWPSVAGSRRCSSGDRGGSGRSAVAVTTAGTSEAEVGVSRLMSRQHERLNRRRWSLERRRVLDRDGWRCRQCGRAGKLEVDHRIPLEDGGAPYDPQNLQSCAGDATPRRPWRRTGLGIPFARRSRHGSDWSVVYAPRCADCSPR